jgi:hypothetical protein
MHRRGFLTGSLLLPPLMAPPLIASAAQTGVAPVVLELFTSQGCSSCPPADALLGELARQPGIIALAWHVDYWNSLGWRDPYAKSEWTERQKVYAKHLKGEVYTPALIVNGSALVIGSDDAAVRRAIGQATPPPVTATLRRGPSGLTAEIMATSLPVTGMLVTYDPEQSTPVGAGENQGRRLNEYRIVRDVSVLEHLETRLSLPPVPDGRGAVLLIQDASWRVVGSADLPPARV